LFVLAAINRANGNKNGCSFQMTTFKMSNKLVATRIKGFVKVVLYRVWPYWVEIGSLKDSLLLLLATQ
jgi:hypothetical protein